MVNQAKFNEIASSVGLFAFGAAVYLFLAPKLFSEPPFIQDGQIFVPGLSEAEQIEAEAQANAVTFADDVVSGVFPSGIRLGNI